MVTGFYRVLLGFAFFYCYRIPPSLIDFTGFYLVLSVFLLSFSGFFPNLPRFTGLYWVLPSLSRF